MQLCRYLQPWLQSLSLSLHKHIPWSCLDSEKKEEKIMKSRNFEFGERHGFDALKTHIICI